MQEYVRNCLDSIEQMWSAGNGKSCSLSSQQAAKLWRVIDHHEFWMIVDLFESRMGDAKTIGYMVIVLEDENNYVKYYREARYFDRTYPASSCGKQIEHRDEISHNERDDQRETHRVRQLFLR